MAAMRVDFYILEGSNIGLLNALAVACQLAEKAYAANQQVYIHMDSLKAAEQLDKLLWTYNDISFLPHEICQTDKPSSAPIQIGYSTPPAHRELLLNLSNQLPVFYKEFNRMMEIVFPDPTMQQLARERYRTYREQGCELASHKIKNS